MKKKLLVLFMVAMSFTFATTGCTKEKESEAASNVVSKETESNIDDVTNEDTSDELTDTTENDTEKEIEDATEDASVENTDSEMYAEKVYTKEDLAKAFLIDKVEMTIETANEHATIINNLPNVMISVTSEKEKSQMDIYFVDKVTYIHQSTDGEDLWMKSSKMEDTIDTMIDGIANVNIGDQMTDVEYVETITEDGITYDVVKATEIRDNKEFQKLMLYINVDTGIVEKSVNDSDGDTVTILYKPCDGFELPKEAENATEI